MTLPIDLVLVRHGESEGNAVKRSGKKGDDTLLQTLSMRHTASFRLTELGKRQAIQAGEWLRNEFYNHELQRDWRTEKPIGPFTRCITSEYFRAMETAGLLNLPDAKWYSDFYITERDWGTLEIFADSDRTGKFADELLRRDVEPFFWRPAHGESFAELCLRVDRVLHTLHRECSHQRVIIVCHGEVMRAFQVRIARLSQVAFRHLHFSNNREDWIYNGQIDHYTRQDPSSERLSPHMDWMRHVRPTESPVWDSGWKEIVRPHYSNDDLLNIVSSISSIIS